MRTMTHKIKISRVNNVVNEITAIEHASKQTAKAALHYKNKTNQINQKIHAIGVITKNVSKQMNTIADVDAREFDILAAIIDNQVELSKQAKNLDGKWDSLVDAQNQELTELQAINNQLRQSYEDMVITVKNLYQRANENHDAYVTTLSEAETHLFNLHQQIVTFNDREHIAQIIILISALNEQLDNEKQAYATQTEKIQQQMANLNTVARTLSTSVNHYSNIIKTVHAKVNYMVEVVDAIDSKVTDLSLKMDTLTQSDILNMFNTFESNTNESESVDNPSDTLHETGTLEDNDGNTPDVPEETNTSNDNDRALEGPKNKNDHTELEAFPPRASHNKKKEASKWKFWSK